MLKNYLKTAIRSLLRHKFFSVINLFGLAVAMAICMGIIMLVADQMMYDQHITKRDRIYRITSRHVNNEGRELGGIDNASSPMPLREELEDNFTGVEKIVRFKRGFGNSWMELENQDINIPLSGFFADPEVLDVFEYKLQYGDQGTALVEPFSVVLTKEAARKLFREENPVGRTVKIGKTDIYTVTGVLEETSRKSHIVFEGLASMATVKSLQAKGRFSNDLENWADFWTGWTYIVLSPGKSPMDLQGHLDKVYQKHIASITNPDTYKAKFLLQPLNGITPGPTMNNAIGPSLPWILVYFLSGLAGLILITSCFNFTNLSIARSLTRAREIGVRKATGASRWQLFVQFLTESIVVASLALVLSYAFLWLSKPTILQLSFARIFKWDLEANYMVFGIFLLFAVLVGILAGFFPATVLSGFQPVKVLKNLHNVKLFSRVGLRKTLLVSQFTLSLIFILTVIVMYNQVNLFMSKDHGFDPEKNMVVKLNNTSHQQLKTELSKYSNIVTASAASHIPAAGVSYGNWFKRNLDEKEWTSLDYFAVDENYLENLNIKLIAGKFYEPENNASNKNFIVLNKKAIAAFHFGTPDAAIGEAIIYQPDSTQKVVIGVVEDYNHSILIKEIGPMALMYNPDEFSILQVKYSGSQQQASEAIEKAWSIVNPGLKIDLKAFKSEMNVFYDTVFGDALDILTVIAALAIIISCLGLLGMATYTTETRMKEISIRKILGSSDGALVYLLSKGFLSIILIAIVIAVPAAYFLNTIWLELMAYHVKVDVVTILLGVSFLILFGVITIGSQTWRAMFVNPTENLKND
jgi:putative ABC transport system permease protein